MRKLFSAAFIALFVLGSRSALAESAKILWLPVERTVFPILSADPRSAQFSAQFYDSAGQTFGLGSIGHQLGLWRMENADGSILQVGLEASAFVRLSLTRTSQNTALQTSDFFFGFPIEYQNGPWAFRLWTFHTSSHLGDNFLLVNGLAPIVYSREAVEALAAYSFSQLTLYAGGSGAIHSIPDVNTAALHGGFEVRSKPLDAKNSKWLYAALDTQPKAEVDWRISTNTQAGIAIKPEGSDKMMRVYLDYFTGPSPEGQLFRNNETFLALGVAFDF